MGLLYQGKKSRRSGFGSNREPAGTSTPSTFATKIQKSIFAAKKKQDKDRRKQKTKNESLFR